MDSTVPVNSQQIDRLRAAYDTCFGCGSANTVGLRLTDFAAIPGGATAPFMVGDDFTGFHGVLHGGVVATALDEIAAWAAILSEGVFVFTAKLDIKYRREARSLEEYALTGTVTQRRGKRLQITSRMAAPAGTVVAESSGLFVVADTVEALLHGAGDNAT